GHGHQVGAAAGLLQVGPVRCAAPVVPGRVRPGVRVDAVQRVVHVDCHRDADRLERAHQVDLPRRADALEHRQVQVGKVQAANGKAPGTHADANVLRTIDVHLPVRPDGTYRLGGPDETVVAARPGVGRDHCHFHTDLSVLSVPLRTASAGAEGRALAGGRPHRAALTARLRSGRDAAETQPFAQFSDGDPVAFADADGCVLDVGAGDGRGHYRSPRSDAATDSFSRT